MPDAAARSAETRAAAVRPCADGGIGAGEGAAAEGAACPEAETSSGVASGVAGAVCTVGTDEAGGEAGCALGAAPPREADEPPHPAEAAQKTTSMSMESIRRGEKRLNTNILTGEKRT